MGKYYGKVGYNEYKQTAPGVWMDEITERAIYGDIYKNILRNERSDGVNDNINVAMQISFIADPYARMNFHHIKYTTYMGTKWKVTAVTEEFPRLTMTLGGVYNENQT